MNKNEDQNTHGIAELKTGVQAGPAMGQHTCLLCGASFWDGEVYPMDRRFFTAEKAAILHVEQGHGDRLEQLLSSGSRYLSFTEHQKLLLRLLATGQSDAEIAVQTGSTAATVRRQRFGFREKAKRARMLLAVCELAEESRARATVLPPQQEGVSPSLSLHQITPQEYDKALKSAFYSQSPLRLRALPAKDKRRFAAMARIAQLFAPNRSYTEPQVNAILEQVHPEEYVVLRRYLVEYGFLAREKDGSRYWMPVTPQ